MRMNKYTESDKCENKAGKSAPLTLTLSRKGRGNNGRKQARGSKRAMLLGGAAVLLALAPVMSATEAKAETCTASPDCKSLGYTESSCSDGGVKCPWGNYWFCGAKKDVCEVKSCAIGDVLYSDKKCYTCLANTLPDQVPIGVVFSSGKAVALTNLSGTMTRSSAASACSSYSAGGVRGIWFLPTDVELLAMYSNRSSIVQGFSNAIGGKDFASSWYWSATFDGGNGYHVVNPVSGSRNYDWNDNNYYYVRPVLRL